MEKITITINSNSKILDLIDKTVPCIFIHRFNPNGHTNWWKTSVSFSHSNTFSDSLVRNMEFDLLTDYNGLKNIIHLNQNYMDIYQFSNPVSDSLRLELLPEDNKMNILIQNGFHHRFLLVDEFLTIYSINKEFISSIRNHPFFSGNIVM